MKKYLCVEECCDILDSQRVPVTASDRTSGIYPYYGANGVQDYVSDYIFDDELILVAEDGGHFGEKGKPIAYRVSGKCWVNNHAHVLKPKVGFDIDYICYSLMFYDTSSIINGSTRQKLNQAQLKKMKIPVLPLEEQVIRKSAIKNIFDSIELKKRQLQSFDSLVKSRFMEMFPDWDLSLQKADWIELKALTKIYTGTTPKTEQKDYWNGDIPWVTPAELNSDSYIVSDTERHLTEAGRASKSLSLMPVGTVLLTTRAPIGKVAICGVPMACNQGFKNFECGSELNPTFLYVLLKLNVEWLQSQGTGTTFKEISKTKAEGIKISVPDIESQVAFENFYKLIDKSRFVCHSRNFL